MLTSGGDLVMCVFVCVCLFRSAWFACEYGGALREACVFDDRRDGLCVACVCVYFRVCVRVENLSVCSLYLRRVNISQCDATLMMQDESSCAEVS